MHSRSRMNPALMAIACFVVVSAAHPQAAEDVAIVFEVAPMGDDGTGDTDIYAQRLAPDGKLLWNEGAEPVPVAASLQRETSPVVCSDGTSGVIVVDEIEYLDGEHAGAVDLFVQRLDSQGQRRWHEGRGPQPLAVSKYQESHPVVVSDGSGGAIVIYQWTDDRGDSDILAQRIGGDGERVWHAGEIPSVLFASDWVERAPVAVPDGRGGAIVVCEWEGPDGDTDVMAQRVSADGEVLWNGGQQAVDVASGTALERRPVAIADGQGGALVAFEFEFPEGEHKGDVDIGAQCISADGVRLWNGGEMPVIVSSGSAIERRPVVVDDGAGGMIVAFEYEPLEGETAGDIDVLAQRLNGDGSLLWNRGEIPSTVSSLPGLERSPRAAALKGGGAVVVFEHEFRGGKFGGDIDLMTTRISPSGERVWKQEERRSRLLAASEWLERSPLPLVSRDGGVIVAYTAIGAEGEWEGDSDIKAVRLSPDGDLTWNDGERPVDVASGTALDRNPAAVLVAH